MATKVTQEQMMTAKTSSDKLKTQFDARQKEAQSGINSAMDTALTGQKSGLQDAYKQQTADLKQNRADMKTAYSDVSRNTRQQINQNARADRSLAREQGVNTGGASQQALQLNMVRSNALGQTYANRQRALEENARQQTLAKTDYRNRVQQAIRDNDYQRAAALLDDYNNQNTWRENNAKILATFGNFDGYGQLYGDAHARAMQNMWAAQNPEIAYNTGAITAEQYKIMTGKDAPGVQPIYSGGGGGGGGSDPYWYDNGRPVAYDTGGSSGGGSSSGGGEVDPSADYTWRVLGR